MSGWGPPKREEPVTETSCPRILLLESEETLAARITQLLEGKAWEVIRLQVSKEALLVLEKSKQTPFDLFISSYQLPKMAGDDVLKEAKTISPMTQRMLLVPENQSDLVIRAINKAEINACIVTPFTDEDLISRVSSCLEAFRKNRKIERLKRVTVHQNKQMFQIAQKLKRKDRIFQDKISEKKAEILLLRSKLRNTTQEDLPATLPQRIRSLGIPLASGPLKKEFLSLADYLLALFDSAAAKSGLDREDPPDITLPVPADDLTGKPDGLPPEWPGLVEQILGAAFSSPVELPEDAEDSLSDFEDDDGDSPIKITFSDDNTKAFARFRGSPDDHLITLMDLLDLLRHKEISFGIVEDDALEAWLSAPGTEPFCVARGEAPIPGKDGAVTYNFETDYSNPGKIMEDGRIDFRDRGSIPFVNKGDILGAKLMPIQGKKGLSVTGETILVEEPFDPVFTPGPGTSLSEDGTTIVAELDGQPHLDYLGEISVNPELPIQGDVDFQTGNINFKGHINVSGTVKEGFTIKGFSLTAKEIEGATIDLTGDLHVSDGITDADIISSGNIYAKFINNSRVKAFGNILIQKEIIDSNVIISGMCQNSSGVIMSSRISAKGGIEAGRIGTGASKPATLKVGVSEHIDLLTEQTDAKLKASVDRLAELRDKIREVEDQDQNLYGQITEKAQIQEAAQNRVKGLKKELTDLKKSKETAALTSLAAQYKAEDAVAKAAEQELNTIFEIQNRYAKQISDLKEMIVRIEETNKNLVIQKRGLKEFAEKTESVPRVTVIQSIAQDTVIAGPNVSYTMKEDRRRCRIEEKGSSEEGLRFFEMEISDLSG